MAHTSHLDASSLEGALILTGPRNAASTLPLSGNILSNGRLTSVVFSSGATRLTIDEMAVNRWRRHLARGSGTSRLYVRDLDTGAVHSLADGRAEGIEMTPGFVRFRTDIGGGLSASVDIFVAAEADLEVRRITLDNGGDSLRSIDVTSCVEIVLGPLAADVGHPAFSKLFVQTSFDANSEAIHAWRRLRSPDERPLRFIHASRGSGRFGGFETSRFAFIGRGRTLDRPQGLDAGAGLDGLEGSVLDPVAVLRRTIELQPGSEATVVFFTGAAREEQEIDNLLETIDAFDAEEELRSTVAVELKRQLLGRIETRQARYFRRLAAALFVDDPRLRARADLVARLNAPASRLSELGIDADLPLVVVRVADREELPLARSMLKAHRYWRELGISANLFLLNDMSDTDEAEAVQALVERAISDFEAPTDVRGGAFSEYADDMLAEDQVLLQSQASIVIRESLPSLDETIDPSERTLFVVPPSGPRTELPELELSFENGYGGFLPDGSEYVIDIPFVDGAHRLPPQPWVNVLANEDFGCIVSETGGGYTWSQNSRENRLTSWSNDLVADPPSERLMIADAARGEAWNVFPGEGAAPTDYRVRHGFGYTIVESVFDGLHQRATVFVDQSEAVKAVRLEVVNKGSHDRDLRVVGAHRLVLGADEEAAPRMISLESMPRHHAVVARNRSNGEFRDRAAFSAMFGNGIEFRRWSSSTFDASDVASPPAHAGGLVGSTVVHTGFVPLEAGASAVVHLLLGDVDSDENLRPTLEALVRADRWANALADVRAFWKELLGGVRICTPSHEIDHMVNGWLPYQNLACRMWGRSAFYQSGGAYGYRDQLQDSSSMIMLDPAITRRQILLHAEQQFEQGDVMHWWHPPTGKGIRTRFSDDLLWLPYITATYVRATGDATVLDESTSFIDARQLKPGEDEIFVHPRRLDREATVYEHCCLAIDRSLTRGPNGLPLMGTGDWNDGMNRVGREGRGESVWLGFFIATIIDLMLPICEQRGDTVRMESYRAYREHLQRQLNDTGWDGEWYRRAYYDNGAVLGSKESDEGRIDALAQAWAVLSGVAPADRRESALDAMERELVDEEAGIIRLLTPAFDRTPNDPGYIKGYVPGVRENGGQYTHAALWAVRALAEAGRKDRAARLLAMLSPISHSSSREAADRYRVEPYVIAADVYGEPPHVGRGGWTWYTGSAGWMYRVALESILGFRMVDGRWLELDPVIPADWDEFSIRYRVPQERTVYDIRVTTGSQAPSATLDGTPLEVYRQGTGRAFRIPLLHDNRRHEVEVSL